MVKPKGTAQGRGRDPCNKCNHREHNKYAANLADLANLAKELQKQHWTKTANPVPQGDKTDNRDSEPIRRLKKILTDTIQIGQLDMNRSPDVMTAMRQEYLRNTDILLYQEPVFSGSNQSQRLFLTPKILGFKKILPIPTDQLRAPPANRFPR